MAFRHPLTTARLRTLSRALCLQLVPQLGKGPRTQAEYIRQGKAYMSALDWVSQELDRRKAAQVRAIIQKRQSQEVA
jgi:hypothetical protein